MADDTIFAVATGMGRAGIAVMRISGPRAGEALRALSGRAAGAPRRLVRVALREPGSGEPLDDCLAAWFPAPASYTGEDVVELHLHGGRAVGAAVAEALAGAVGLRPAEPGEFTRRAFGNGKLDLTAAEGLADLAQAETAAQRRQALRQMRGELAALYEGWRGRLVRALAYAEAAIDFSDEDLPADPISGMTHEIVGISSEIAVHLDDCRRGERIREGVSVALVGAPNVGKSSLLNRLVRREAAIVSARAGTTRDVIEVGLDLGGYPVLVADLAGVREAADEVEAEGVRRARRWTEEADLTVVLFDGTRWPDLDPATLALVDERAVVVVNKADLAALPAEMRVAGRPALAVSALTGVGLGALLGEMTARVAGAFTAAAGPPLTRERHRAALRACHEALERGRGAASPELAAEDLRLAVRALGRITGRVDVEDLLDVIFRDFCIGK
ncbi:MAG: tRNA uridine-5-carboxymethylaminomethyl(34) synthesis GTPase MnmE [Proteobacteria bacterium]|nr:tRNA uridine-5-carboxymethylaminomethyl(34) synthesis GTPase MnmE [Pseudomonadota bacterium]